MIIKEVKPIVVYPLCFKSNKKQDCFNCEIYKKGLCKSPRGLCARPYEGHPKGCPQYGKNLGCPPFLPMFDEIIDMSKPIYAIVTEFDLEKHMNKMKKRHPHWTERQLRNPLYWQGTDKKLHKEAIAKFNEDYSNLGYKVIIRPEAFGVNVTDTLKQIDINLVWPPNKYVYRTSFAGILKDSNKLEEYNLIENKGCHGENFIKQVKKND